MIRAFFEGPAGSGKTHKLVDETVAVAGGLLSSENSKLLALTFMNGARHRLNARFAAVPALRGRFLCSTFDSFATLLARRRRTLLNALPPDPAEAKMSVFDRTCSEAVRLLEVPAVAAWVAAAYPLVVVDEAQDLDPHRFRMLRTLAGATHVIGAADEFQNLSDAVDAADVMAWLREAEKTEPLTTVRRTNKEGLLRVAGALRDGGPVCGELSALAGKKPRYVGAGVRVIESPAKPGLLAWNVAYELRGMGSSTVILTPDASSELVRQVVERVHSEPPFLLSKKTGETFGPYPLTWELREEEDVRRVMDRMPEGDVVSLSSAIEAAAALTQDERGYIRARLERGRNLRGESSITQSQLRSIVEDVLRDSRRLGLQRGTGRRVMTIQRAKNREFRDVLVLWPQSATGSAEHQRRLLYNAVTRAQDRCAIVVFGQGRTKKPPFAAQT